MPTSAAETQVSKDRFAPKTKSEGNIRIGLLLLAFVCWLALVLFVSQSTPLAGPPNWITLDSDGKNVIANNRSGAKTVSDRTYYRINIESGEIDTIGHLELLTLNWAQAKRLPDKASLIYDWKNFLNSDQPNRTLDVATIDTSTQEILQQREITFPVTPNTLNHRFLVGFDKQFLYSLDISNQDASIQRVAAPLGVIDIFARPELKTFVVLRKDPKQTAVPLVSTPIFADLMRLDEKGNPALIVSWSMANNPDGNVLGSITIIDDQIVSLSADCKSVEFRDSQNGELVFAESLPSDFSLKKRDTWFFSKRDLRVRTKERAHFFSLLTRKWLQRDSDGEWLVDHTADFAYYVDSTTGKRLTVIDSSGNNLWNMQCEQSSQHVGTIDNKFLVSVDRNFGLSVNVLDLHTGELIRRIQPMWWIPPAVILIVTSFLVWCYAWFRITAWSKSWGWLDVLLVGSTILILLAARAMHAGNPTDSTRVLYQYASGVAFGLLTLTALWIAFGTSRLTLRLQPMILATALISAILVIVFTDELRIAFSGLLSLVLPACFLLAFACYLRFVMRFKLINIQFQEPQPHRSIVGGSYTILDLILLATASAGLVATLRPIIVANAYFINLPLNLYSIVAALAGLTSACVTLMLPDRHLRTFIALVILCIGLLVAESLYDFISDQYDRRLYATYDPLRSISTACAAIPIMLMPYRIRGWRFSRTQSTQSETPESVD